MKDFKISLFFTFYPFTVKEIFPTNAMPRKSIENGQSGKKISSGRSPLFISSKSNGINTTSIPLATTTSSKGSSSTRRKKSTQLSKHQGRIVTISRKKRSIFWRLPIHSEFDAIFNSLCETSTVVRRR